MKNLEFWLRSKVPLRTGFRTDHVRQIGKSVQHVSTKYATGCIINISFPACRFLASGDSYDTLAGRFRIAYSTVSIIIPCVCTAVRNLMVDTFMRLPTTEADWNRIEYGFRTCWNFPNCCGAIDGKHVALRSPPNSGSLYFNYENHFSVVLMALVDDSYKFIYVDVGNYGSNSDSWIFKNSHFGQCFMQV